MTAEATWLNEPQQARSEETLRRVLDAAAELLEEGFFERATIQEIVRRAGTSVGAFYARFKDKEALFHVLHERLLADVEEVLMELTAVGPPSDVGLEEAVRRLVSGTLSVYAERRGILRSLALYARSDSHPRFAERAVRTNRLAFERVHAMLMEREAEITHPSPGTAIRVGTAMVTSTLREIILFGEAGLTPTGLETDELARELTRAWLAYLTTTEPETGDRP